MKRLLFAVMGDAELRYVLPLAKALREAGVAVEVYPEAAKLKKQFDYAQKRPSRSSPSTVPLKLKAAP